VRRNFFQEERGWVEAVCEAVADAAESWSRTAEEFRTAFTCPAGAGIPQAADQAAMTGRA